MINKTGSNKSNRWRKPLVLEIPGNGYGISVFKRYGVAVVSVFLVAFIRFLLNPMLGEYAAFILFVPAIIISAWLGGLGPGILASVASLLIADFYFVDPFDRWSSFNLRHIISGATYLFSSAVVAGLVTALRREQQRVLNQSQQNLNRAEALQNEVARRQEAEQRLREREERLRLIFENARGMAIISFDLSGRIDDWNDGAANIFGYSKDEILGRHFHEIFTPEDRALQLPEAELKDAREKRATGDDRWHLAKDGRRVFLNGITCGKFNEKGDLVGYLKIARDNTERENIQNALRQSEWRFRKVFGSAAVGIVQVDSSGRFLDANEKFCRTTGYTLEELRVKTFFEITHPDDQAENAESFRRMLSGEALVFEIEKRCVCKNGSVIWAHVTASLLRDELNNPVLSIAVVTNVTERKISERKLRESEERLRLATDAGNIGLWHWDLNSGTQEWSPIAREHLGRFSDTKASLEDFMACLHKDDFERVQSLCLRSIDEHDHLDVEYRVVWPDKTVHWIWAKGRFISERANLGKVFIGVTMDITERKRADEKLQHAVSLYRAILESTDNGILVIDLDGKVVASNQRFRSMWRIPDAIFIAKNDDALLNFVLEQLQNPDAFLAKVNSLMKSDAEDRDEILFKDGRIFQRYSQPHRIDHTIIGRVWSFRDVTARRNAEASLARAREQLMEHARELEGHVANRTMQLQKALNDMETFLYAIAHDLRAPLRAMRSFVDLLSEEYAPRLDPTAQDYCRRINDAAFRMNQLITDILTYGRLSHTDMPHQPVDLSTEVDKVLVHTSKEIEARHAEIQVDKPLPKVYADASVLDQVIENLIANAMKFVPSERIPRLHIYAEEHEDNVRLCLEDNGIGIAPEDQSRIFGPFQRLHSAEEYPGTGIGLAIVQRGIEKMGGHVGVESNLGQGSRFWVELPKEDGHGE